MLVTCKHCGTPNQLGDIPRGRKAVCGNCRRDLLEETPPPPAKSKGKMSGTVWAWIAILGIGFFAWKSDASRSKDSPKRNDSQSDRSSSRPNSSKYRSSAASSPTRPVFDKPKQPLPFHGQITWHSFGDSVAPLEIRSSTGSHYVVKLCDYYSGRDVLSVFVHGGTVAKLDVPLGKYRIKYASGSSWYGPMYLFGPETSCCVADSEFDFRVNGNQISGYTLTLYKVVHGNLHTSEIPLDQF